MSVDFRQEFRLSLESTEACHPIDFWQKKALKWALDQYDHVVLFNNNQRQLPGFQLPYSAFPNRLAAGLYQRVDFPPETDPFDQLFHHHQQQPDFLVGYFSYDLKNRIEALRSRHPNWLEFPAIYFFQPLHILDFEENSILIRSWSDPQHVAQSILASSIDPAELETPAVGNTLQAHVSPAEYRQIVQQIREDIIDGTVYELNYCLAFFAEAARLNPFAVYEALNRQSPMPFSHFQRIGNHYVLGASPERFLKKEGDRLISQPIKGTIRRGANPVEDEHLKRRLSSSEKEQAENLMIVDLVRNDLARSAKTGTVRVDELFGVYAFRQLFQMISTVSATIQDDLPFTDAIRNAFPMGSMTGAPKVRAMELIDQYEASRRGLYSGAAGYITPDGDFDFNVMIRSIFYNQALGRVSFSVGSAITYDADPEQEYEECLLKARAMRSVF
ncbi:anthranilate synthase component I family protein [Larkinella bovis]|uniref:Anthranilate synthase component I family protein n=1 Tax=Larkinella bovis TaxID=683041 RepID=A0ABW0I3P3_9BACT